MVRNISELAFLIIPEAFEIRNKYSKICLGKKDVTLIKNDLKTSNEIVVFEGFF